MKDWNATFVSTLKVSDLYIMHLLENQSLKWLYTPRLRLVSNYSGRSLSLTNSSVYFESIVPVSICNRINARMASQDCGNDLTVGKRQNFRQWTGDSQLVDLPMIYELSSRRREYQKFTLMIFHSRCRSIVDAFRLNPSFLNYPAIYICRAPQSPLFFLARIFFLCCTLG